MVCCITELAFVIVNPNDVVVPYSTVEFDASSVVQLIISCKFVICEEFTLLIAGAVVSDAHAKAPTCVPSYDIVQAIEPPMGVKSLKVILAKFGLE